MYTAYICMPAKYILSDNFTSEWHVPANSGLSRGPLSQPPFQWRSQRACHTGVSNAWKRQRVIDTPCPIARYTIGWCQLEVRAMTRSWNGAWFGQTGYIMYINIYKLKLRRACYHFLPWRAWEWRVYVGAIYLHLRNSVISSNKEWPWDILSSLTHQWNLGIISCNSDMPSLKCAPFTETCEACILPSLSCKISKECYVTPGLRTLQSSEFSITWTSSDSNRSKSSHV